MHVCIYNTMRSTRFGLGSEGAVAAKQTTIFDPLSERKDIHIKRRQVVLRNGKPKDIIRGVYK